MGGLCNSESSHQKHHHGNMQYNAHSGMQGQYQPNNVNSGMPMNMGYAQVDPVLRQRGPRYLIRQVKHDQGESPPGGKMPIKLIFSLDRGLMSSNKNPASLAFRISISESRNPKSFKPMSTISDLNLDDFVYANQIITEYFFEFDQQIKIETLYNNMKVQEDFVSTAKINGSLNHLEEVPLLLSGPGQSPDFKLLVLSDPIAEHLSRVAITFDMRLESNSNDEFFAVFENTFKNKRQKIFKTEEVKGPYPKIVASDIAFLDLCFDNSNDTEFNIEFFTIRGGMVSSIGVITSNLNNLDNMTLDVKDPKSNAVTAKATISTSRRNIKRFVDYIYTDKLQISMLCAVDFTGSNGEPHLYNSLHYINNAEPNQYQQALQASASIVSYYDSDKKFPVYGFGAQYKGDVTGTVSHCFNLNFSNDNPEVEGVQSIMDTYKNALPKLNLSGPTYFSPCIYKTIEYVRSKGIENSYYIMLIITDGQINDMPETRKAIIEASVLPISIIIVGVGNANFSSMDQLDGDESPLVDAYGRKIRDIVQFVKYENRYAMNLALFSQDLLYEIPNQVEGYFRSIGK
jgi:hypothetical protein